MADLNYLLSKVGKISPATRSKAVEIILAAEKAGHKVRFVWGMGSGKEHGSGNALDLMVNNEAAGDWIRNYVWANRARLRLRHVIWEQHITSTVVQPGVRRKMEDRGSTTENHYDHNHIWFLDAQAYVPPGKAPAPSKPAAQPTSGKKSLTVVAREVWQGKWGNGDDRKKRLKAAGYDPDRIQALVNKGVGVKGASSDPHRKSVSQLATEVIAGKWGNGDDRIRRLKAKHYDYKAVQAEVNRRL